jgi:8-oxo-dGTP diphosphatase
MRFWHSTLPIAPAPEGRSLAGRTLRAAGGVLYRVTKGEPEFLVARRPRYGDWTLPKGKLDPGEGPQEAALREVREETGFTCRTESEVGSIGYRLRSGRLKAVRYWVMRAEDGEFRPNAEVDRVKWLSGADAAKRLSYPKERSVLERAVAMVEDPGSGMIHLVRDAASGTPTKGKNDKKRPLSKRGSGQALKLSRRLAKGPIVDICSSPFVRCMQTVQPLGNGLGIAVERNQRLAEGGKLEAMLDVMADLAGLTAVVCTHADMIALMLEHLAEEGVDLGASAEFRKASVWTFTTFMGEVTAASYRRPPS